jgi:hypothetical protein
VPSVSGAASTYCLSLAVKDELPGKVTMEEVKGMQRDPLVQ